MTHIKIDKYDFYFMYELPSTLRSFIINFIIREKNKNINYISNIFHITPFFGDIIKNIKNRCPLYILMFESGQLKAYTLNMVEKIYGINFIMFLGPIIWNSDINNDVQSIFFNTLTRYYYNKNFFFYKSSIFYTNYNKHIIKKRFLQLKNIKGGTYILNLENSLDNIRRSFSHSLRRTLKKAEQQNMEFKIISNKYQDILLYDYYLKKIKGNNVGILYPYSKLFKYFTKLDNKLTEFKVFAVFFKQKPLAFINIIKFSDVIIEKGLIVFDYAKKNKLYAGDFLKWEIIKYFKNKNVRYYDIAGITLNPKDKKSKGILQYKKKWNGFFVPYEYSWGILTPKIFSINRRPK